MTQGKPTIDKRQDVAVARRFERTVSLILECAADPAYRRQHNIVNSICCWRCAARPACIYVFDTYLVSFDFLAICTMRGVRRVMADLRRCKRGDTAPPAGWCGYLAGYRRQRAARAARARNAAGSTPGDGVGVASLQAGVVV